MFHYVFASGIGSGGGALQYVWGSLGLKTKLGPFDPHALCLATTVRIHPGYRHAKLVASVMCLCRPVSLARARNALDGSTSMYGMPIIRRDRFLLLFYMPCWLRDGFAVTCRT